MQLFEFDSSKSCRPRVPTLGRSRNSAKPRASWLGRVAHSSQWRIQEILRAGFAEICGLVEKKNWLQRAFGEFAEAQRCRNLSFRQSSQWIPNRWAACAGSRADSIRERKDRGADDGRDGALRARIKFADTFDRVAQKFDTNGPRSFGRENVDNPAANGKLAREFDHFLRA